MSRVVGADLRVVTAHHAADRVRASPSAIMSMSGSSARSMPSSVRMRSPGARARMTSAPLRQPLEVERVHRLSELEHHVVGDVDDVADRADAGGSQAIGQPLRRGPDGDLEHLRAVARAEVGSLESHVDPERCSARPDRPPAPSCPAAAAAAPRWSTASRARPTWLRQSGRFAVISKSMTGKSPGSIDATSNPRRLISCAMGSGVARDADEVAQPGVDEPHSGNCSRKRRSFS